MASGTAVLSSDVPAVREVTAEAAVLVEPTDVDALSRALIELLHDSAKRAQLERQGLERAALFTWERCAELTHAVYRTALES